MYGLDLREVLWGANPWGVRRVLSHVDWLPANSAVRIASGESWTQQEEIMATIADLIGVGNHYTLATNVKQGTKLPDPFRFPRPWEKPQGPRAQSSKDALRAFFGTQADDPEKVKVN